MYDGLKWEGGVTAADDRPEYSGFDNHPRDKGFESTGFQAMLCPAAVLCFHMDSQTWNCISSNRLKRVPWRSELIERLELDVEKKDMLVNLVEGYRTNKNQGVQDLIQGKGEVRYTPKISFSKTDGVSGLGNIATWTSWGRQDSDSRYDLHTLDRAIERRN